MKREDILKVYEAGPEAVVQLVESLWAHIQQLDARVKVLEAQLNKNSRNSGKPPSSDGFKKPNPKSLREKGAHPVGGQKGHPGHTRFFVNEPDHIELHRVTTCSCGHSLEQTPTVHHERRQVWDKPPLKLEVTEHLAEVKCCPKCGSRNKAMFPTGVTSPVQYGASIQSLLVYLSQYQLLPYERIQELFQDLFNHKLSQATCVRANRYLYDKLEAVETQIAEHIQSNAVVHFDETGMRVLGKTNWLHVASTAEYTHYSVHLKRGQEGSDAAGILPLFANTAMHDAWKPYWRYNCLHVLCNAHHLRELTFIFEQEGQKWAKAMANLLVSIKGVVDQRRGTTDTLELEQIVAFVRQYDRILELGLIEDMRMNPPQPVVKKQGRTKQSKAKNLLDRLSERKVETLAFMCDFRIPFDNNQAERDIRMTKVQQKISGTFRSTQGAESFCRIRGYISTMKKQSLSVIQGIEAAFLGRSFLPFNI